MTRARLNALEVLRLLPRTNCKRCGLTTCLAFANQVALGLRDAQECPELDRGAVSLARDLVVEEGLDEERSSERLDELTRRVREIDLASVAPALGGWSVGGDLSLLCLGRVFTVDALGRLRSQCHANFWVLLPLLDAIVHAASEGGSAAGPLAGEWVKFDQLRLALSRSGFFTKNTEDELRALADRDLPLLSDLLELFGAKRSGECREADLSLVLRPLPRLPLLLCYWRAEGEFPSKLSVYFDRTADSRLSIESLHVLITGVVTMLKRLLARHRFELEGLTT